VATDWLPLISRLELLKAHAGRKSCHVPLHEILIYRFILRSKVAVVLIFTPEGLLDSHSIRSQRRSSKPAEVREDSSARANGSNLVGLGPSRGIVLKLSALFGMHSFGGGLWCRASRRIGFIYVSANRIGF
jgi:hypothetical protein